MVWGGLKRDDDDDDDSNDDYGYDWLEGSHHFVWDISVQVVIRLVIVMVVMNHDPHGDDADHHHYDAHC